MKTLSSALNPYQCTEYYEITHGINIDCFLYKEEFKIQRAWIEMLSDIKYLNNDEALKLIDSLNDLYKQIEDNVYVWKIENEDIHMSIERFLTYKNGDLGKKIHLGRSRNDLIATTLKLFLSNQALELSQNIKTLCETLVKLAERGVEIIIPSYTHSQAALPIRLGHLWNFHAINFLEDIKSFRHLNLKLLEVMPLGSSAISGTHLPINLSKLATKLCFKKPPLNSLHGVSDRDFIIQTAQAVSLFGLHLSRLCEEIIFWSSSLVKIFSLPTEWSSGSSIMPHKKNPDFFEILRAKAKKFILLSTHVTTINSDLMSGYASDFHEQKKIIVLALNELKELLSFLPMALSKIDFNNENAQKLLNQKEILSTDRVHALVSEGMSFRNAYLLIAGQITDTKESSPSLKREEITFLSSVESRNNCGGTSKEQVTKTSQWIKNKIL